MTTKKTVTMTVPAALERDVKAMIKRATNKVKPIDRFQKVSQKQVDEVNSLIEALVENLKPINKEIGRLENLYDGDISSADSIWIEKEQKRITPKFTKLYAILEWF